MRKFIFGLIVLAVGTVFPAAAQEVKLGFAQPDYILALLPEAQAAQRDIEAFERKLSNKLTAMRQGLQLQAVQLEQEAPNLSDSVKAERQRELQTLQQDIRQEQNTAQQQMQFKEIQSLSPLRQRVQQVIDSVAQANGYTYVFSATAGNQATLVYTEDPAEADVTALVVEALGLTAPADTTGQ